MKRREFLTASATVGLAAAATPVTLTAAASSGKDLFELRRYTFDSTTQQQAWDSFLARSAVPALNRAGVGPVGVFKLLKSDNPKLGLAEDSTDLHVLMPHKSMDSVVHLIERLAQDQTLISTGTDALLPPQSAPAYKRYESSLLLAFDATPHLEVPTQAPGRLLQLRIYESHSTERHLRKVEMFNTGGEIAIFRRCGLPIVFFGQALIGSKLPNLTYMLAFEDEAAMKKAWDTFGQDPGWKQLREDPAYRETVSTITNLILCPAASSQI